MLIQLDDIDQSLMDIRLSSSIVIVAEWKILSKNAKSEIPEILRFSSNES